jgi:hypothetical protein
MGADIDVKTKLRNLDCDWDFSTVKTDIKIMLGSRLSIENIVRQIKTPRLKNMRLAVGTVIKYVLNFK